MQRQELAAGLRKIDFAAIRFVPNVPDDPIGKVLEQDEIIVRSDVANRQRKD
jgi:hypothetical protein